MVFCHTFLSVLNFHFIFGVHSKHPWMTFFSFSHSLGVHFNLDNRYSWLQISVSHTKFDDLLILNGKTFIFMRQSDLSLLLKLWHWIRVTKHLNIIFDKQAPFYYVCDVSERMSKTTSEWWILSFLLHSKKIVENKPHDLLFEWIPLNQ